MKNEHKEFFMRITKDFPVNDFLFEESECFPESRSDEFIETFFEKYDVEEKLLFEGTLKSFSYGPAMKESALVPKITFWSQGADSNVSWGMVSDKGFLSRG